MCKIQESNVKDALKMNEQGDGFGWITFEIWEVLET
jgi:hypothetical protein